MSGARSKLSTNGLEPGPHSLPKLVQIQSNYRMQERPVVLAPIQDCWINSLTGEVSCYQSNPASRTRTHIAAANMQTLMVHHKMDGSATLLQKHLVCMEGDIYKSCCSLEMVPQNRSRDEVAG